MYHAPRQFRCTIQKTHQQFHTSSWHMVEASFKSTARRGLTGVNQGIVMGFCGSYVTLC